jgi:hypothetical protein
LLLLGAASIVGFASNLFQKPSWTIDDINKGFLTPIPDTALNITVDGYTDRGGFLRLTFDAPAPDAHTFAEQFCMGVLYPGYDPFSAIDVAEPFTYAIPIRIGNYNYFSYSPNVDKKVYGNRCLFSASGGQIQIRLDTSRPNVSQIMLDKRFSCEDACHFVPLNIT